MPLVPYLGTLPTVGEDVEIDDEGFVIGKVTLERGSQGWRPYRARRPGHDYRGRLRASDRRSRSTWTRPSDADRLEVVVEDDAIVHGTILGDAVLVERDATILTGSSVGEGSIVQAGALVPEESRSRPRSVIAGTQAR